MPFGVRKSRLHASLRSLQYTTLSQYQCLHTSPSRSFSSTVPYHGFTDLRVAMFKWLNGPGAVFKNPRPGFTNYINAYEKDTGLLKYPKPRSRQSTNPDSETIPGNEDDPPQEAQNQAGAQTEELTPFPLNKKFHSQQVLNEKVKDQIWDAVVLFGKSVQTVSTELNVEMRRVGAVVRLKTIEKQWVEQDKPLATAYASAILDMLPQTNYVNCPDGTTRHFHESINDLPVHRATLTQNFYPVSESRHFTRRDAGKVFHRKLLPPEDRIPHPQLVEREALILSGMTKYESNDIIKKKMQQKETQRAASRKELQAREKRLVKKVLPGGEDARCEFRFRDISVEFAGKDGRDPRGIGMRYGLPPQDRKKGQIKIPTKVEL